MNSSSRGGRRERWDPGCRFKLLGLPLPARLGAATGTGPPSCPSTRPSQLGTQHADSRVLGSCCLASTTPFNPPGTRRARPQCPAAQAARGARKVRSSVSSNTSSCKAGPARAGWSRLPRGGKSRAPFGREEDGWCPHRRSPRLHPSCPHPPLGLHLAGCEGGL